MMCESYLNKAVLKTGRNTESQGRYNLSLNHAYRTNSIRTSLPPLPLPWTLDHEATTCSAGTAAQKPKCYCHCPTTAKVNSLYSPCCYVTQASYSKFQENAPDQSSLDVHTLAIRDGWESKYMAFFTSIMGDKICLPPRLIWWRIPQYKKGVGYWASEQTNQPTKQQQQQQKNLASTCICNSS